MPATNLLRPAPVSTDRFTWTADHRMFVAEMSSLPGFGRVWNDACDVGLTLVSHTTGREVVCYVHEECKDREGDTTHWVLKPVNASDMWLGWEVHVLNT